MPKEVLERSPGEINSIKQAFFEMQKLVAESASTGKMTQEVAHRLQKIVVIDLQEVDASQIGIQENDFLNLKREALRVAYIYLLHIVIGPDFIPGNSTARFVDIGKRELKKVGLTLKDLLEESEIVELNRKCLQGELIEHCKYVAAGLVAPDLEFAELVREYNFTPDELGIDQTAFNSLMAAAGERKAGVN